MVLMSNSREHKRRHSTYESRPTFLVLVLLNVDRVDEDPWMDLFDQLAELNHSG